MKYASSNLLEDFEFHDAFLKYESFCNATLVVSVRYLNIHKTAEQNSYDNDMEIELAKITFYGFCVKQYEPGRTWYQNEKGELCTDEPQVIFEGTQAEEKLFANFQSGSTIYDLGIHENGNCYLDASGVEPFFYAQFSFDSAVVEWDKYCNIAWYEEKH